VLTAYSRVTVVSGSRKVDLALPSALPVADIVPQVLRYSLPDADDQRPTAWTLARVGGLPLSLNQTLAESGVLDGEVLELREDGSSVRPALVEDVRDALEDSVDAAGGWWTPRTTLTFSLIAGAAVLGLLAVVLYRFPEVIGGAEIGRVDGLVTRGDAQTAFLVSTFAALTVSFGLMAWSAAFSHRWVTQVWAAVAMAWAYLAGTEVAIASELDPEIVIILGWCFVGVIVTLARVCTEAAMPHVAAAVVLVSTGLAYGFVWLGDVDVDQVVRITPAVAMLAAGVLPRLTLSVGGLASADYRVRHAGRLSEEGLVTRYRQSNWMLIGGLVGFSIIVAWCSLTLTFSTEDWDRYLALSVAVAALLRSRVYSRTPHMVPLRAAAVAVGVMQLVRLTGDEPDLREWVIPGFAGIALLLVAASTLPMTDITRAQIKRVLNVAEFLVVVDMVVVTLGAVGVFSEIEDAL
jgi:type VII secretion integral membrane protein EccD